MPGEFAICPSCLRSLHNGPCPENRATDPATPNPAARQGQPFASNSSYEARCVAVIVLRDGSTATCQRWKRHGDLCSQHHQQQERRKEARRD